ncbi:hypothetical protein [Symbiopectobacterium sp. RP]|uniref:hypothetical protein n=1 Tax=Symbiopectobacterium sp. RP TaxID=3248553 RepID=UPI003D2C1718
MGTSKKREWLRYRDFVLSPYGVIKIKSLGYMTGKSFITALTVMVRTAFTANLVRSN